jgi:hypothetical protein
MGFLNDLLPLLLILLIFPIVLFMSGRPGQLARRAVIPIISVILVFFIINSILQPAYRQKDLLFAFFSLILLWYSIKRQKSAKKA